MKKATLFLLYSIPITLLIGFLSAFSINVPIHDEWRLVPLFEKVAMGQATWGDFWALHSNHRILFPKIILTSLAFISHWNINYELLFSVGLAILTWLILYRLSVNQAQKEDRLFHVANILTSLWIFSLVQHENWLWGFQLAWFLVNFCLVIAIFVLTSHSPLGTNTKLIVAAIFCGIASFSLAQGLLSWLAVIPSVFAIEGKVTQKRTRLIGWIALFIGTCIIYFFDYHPNRKVSLISLLEKPLVVVNYFLNLLGSPIVRLPIFSAITGLFVLFCFVFLAVSILKKSPKSRELSPWISMGLFAILASLSITAGRVEYGANQAIVSSRYTTISILLIVATIQLSYLFLQQPPVKLKPFHPYVHQLLAGGLVGIVLLNSQQAIAQSQSTLTYRQGAKTCLELIDYLDPSNFSKNSSDSCLKVLTEKTWLVRDGVKTLKKLNWRKFPQDISFIPNPSEGYGYLDRPQTLAHPFTMAKTDSVQIGGWAIRPNRETQPDLVFLSSNDRPSFVANAYVNLDSPDIAQTFNRDRYRQARWKVSLSGDSLPLGKTTLKAWVYNPEDNQFVKLQGDAQVAVEEE